MLNKRRIKSRAAGGSWLPRPQATHRTPPPPPDTCSGSAAACRAATHLPKGLRRSPPACTARRRHQCAPVCRWGRGAAPPRAACGHMRGTRGRRAGKNRLTQPMLRYASSLNAYTSRRRHRTRAPAHLRTRPRSPQHALLVLREGVVSLRAHGQHRQPAPILQLQHIAAQRCHLAPAGVAAGACHYMAALPAPPSATLHTLSHSQPAILHSQPASHTPHGRPARPPPAAPAGG